MKSEPDTYSIENLKNDKTTLWNGVRNYQARNIMRDQMQVGDEILFYHSNSDPSGIAGLATVCARAVPDPSQFDPKSKYYDNKATPEFPRWFCVEVQYKSTLKKLIPLSELKTNPKLKDMLVVQKGQRLSVQPVLAEHFQLVLQMAK